jgi:hypothetical protein
MGCRCRKQGREKWGLDGCYLPTLTAVLLSSSDALLPPGLLLMLRRLELRLGRIIALTGRGTPFAGDPGGEVAMCAATAAPLTCGIFVRRPLQLGRGLQCAGAECRGGKGEDRLAVVEASVCIRVVMRVHVSLLQCPVRRGGNWE